MHQHRGLSWLWFKMPVSCNVVTGIWHSTWQSTFPTHRTLSPVPTSQPWLRCYTGGLARPSPNPAWQHAINRSPELLIALSASHDDVDPDPQDGGARSDEVDALSVGLHTECQVRCWAAHWSQVIEEHVDNVAERHSVSGTSADRRVRSTTVPTQSSMCSVEDKPASVPSVYQSATRHLGQSTLTRGRREMYWRRVVLDAVPWWLDELTQVERRVTHWQVACQRPTLAHIPTHTYRQAGRQT